MSEGLDTPITASVEAGQNHHDRAMATGRDDRRAARRSGLVLLADRDAQRTSTGAPRSDNWSGVVRTGASVAIWRGRHNVVASDIMSSGRQNVVLRQNV